MNKIHRFTLLSLIVILTLGCGFNKSSEKREVAPPKAFGPVPDHRQTQWHNTEFYALICYGLNTFTDKEWGYGNEDPGIFNPSDFDAGQIVLTCKNAGMKGIILTCKHHDGFCLWPTATTEYSVRNTPWKNGGGDMVGEFEKACREQGMKFGVYLSPWDRNHSQYGDPAYIRVYRQQLTELLTGYGEVFEVWFDGANGGTGYYGGADEERKVDRSSYYDWDSTFQLVYELQENAAIFSDIGPDVRWVGNESGYSKDPCWHRFTPKGRDGGEPGIGYTQYWEAMEGHREGELWMPAEVDVPIRPGWYYHEVEDGKVKTPEYLMSIFYESVGHGTTLILGLAPDRRGLIHVNDSLSLLNFRQILDATFKTDLSLGAKIRASNVRGKNSAYTASNMLDARDDSYWCTDDDVLTPEVIFEFADKISFNVVNMREYTQLGQRVWGWALDKWQEGTWSEFAKGESIGHRRLWRGPLQITDKVRFRITEAPVCPAISKFSMHLEPTILDLPEIPRVEEK